MKIYDAFFRRHGIVSAQILLTREDLSNRKRYLNAKNTLSTLSTYKVIPIINENDTVSVDEIKFGDNDKLSALVANLVHADLLIILSDVDGLYATIPKERGAEAENMVIAEVEKITPEIERIASTRTSRTGIGGMASKLEAARICCAAGIACIFANGKTPNILLKLLDEQNIGTLFLPQKKQLVAKKRWIRFSAKVNGQIIVDEGARQALIVKNKSLLPKGVIKLRGNFALGDTVSILDSQNREFARGLANYSSGELNKIKGQRSDQIKSILGYKYYDEAVHRDNLVIL
jgi:glutamate 5-kinase